MSELIKNSGIYQRLTSSTQELERLFTQVDEKKTPPDIKKVLLLMGLGTLSWVSTYSGLLELISANSGDIAFTYKLAIGFAVAMLMLMIVYILDQLFAPLNWLLRTIYIFGYIFLTIISVGFGFGFYWKFLESRSEATRSAESAITQVQSALQGGQTRLEQLEQTLTSLTALSLQKAKEEREQGNSCPNSRPGDGPRRRLRDQDAKNFSFSGDFVTKRAQSVANDIKNLNGNMAKIASRHPSTVDPTTGTRNAYMKKLNQQLDLTITRFNAFRTDPQLKGIRNNLAERSTTTIFPNGAGGTFQCPDQQLQSALRGVVQAIDQLPLVQKPKINATEGSEATIEAFRRLGATLSGLLVLKMPPSEDDLRELRKKAVRSLDKKQSKQTLTNVQPGLNERDYIPLAIAVFVDFCLLLVSINRPMDRLKSLVPVMKEARDGPISGILSSFHATHFAGMREEFSLFQHVVFDWGGHYYVAVPLASNDIQAQYLANLFVSLEGRGIVDRAMIPPSFIIRSKLKKMGSSFADHRAFRLYKFRNGAWSNIVMDAVMGAAKDVSIAVAQKQSENQLNFANDDQIQTEHNPNFASLFSSKNNFPAKGSPLADSLVVDQDNQSNNQEEQAVSQALHSQAFPSQAPLSQTGHIAPIDEQPVIEMPRLFRSIKSEQKAQDQNKEDTKEDNIISPVHFKKPHMHAHHLQSHTAQPTLDQQHAKQMGQTHHKANFTPKTQTNPAPQNHHMPPPLKQMPVNQFQAHIQTDGQTHARQYPPLAPAQNLVSEQNLGKDQNRAPQQQQKPVREQTTKSESEPKPNNSPLQKTAMDLTTKKNIPLQSTIFLNTENNALSTPDVVSWPAAPTTVSDEKQSDKKEINKKTSLETKSVKKDLDLFGNPIITTPQTTLVETTETKTTKPETSDQNSNQEKLKATNKNENLPLYQTASLASRNDPKTDTKKHQLTTEHPPAKSGIEVKKITQWYAKTNDVPSAQKSTHDKQDKSEKV